MHDNGDYVRSAYRVPARRRMVILFQGNPVEIVGFEGQYLVVLIGGMRFHIHPVWEVEYPAA